MEEEIVVADDSKTAEETVDLDTTEETAEETTEESVEDVKARLTKAEELAQNYKVRAEKAEKKAKETKVEKVEPVQGLSSKDTIALINAKVNEDDIEEVIEYAKFKKISVSEALKSSVIKASLTEREEQRNTANATSTGKSRGAAKVSGEALLAKAQKTGEIPDSDEGISALIAARMKK